MVLVACALLMSYWVQVPWLAVVGLLLVCLGAVGEGVSAHARRFWALPFLLAWSGTALVAGGCIWSGFSRQGCALDLYHCGIAWQIAAALALAGRIKGSRSPQRGWKLLGFGWALAGSVLWLAIAYRDNLPGAFHVGVAINIALLLGCRFWFRLSRVGIQTIHTVVLLLAGLPLADFFLRPSYRPAEYLPPAKRYFSYTAANKDPATFARWCGCFLQQWDRMAADVFIPDPEHRLPVRLRPGGQGMLFDGRISINHLGFRGKEIAQDKGRAYRIVAMGESTTFGCTINAGEQPWPELLEQMIRERLRPGRPVEVINAGVPANNLGNSINRLPLEVLPLQPDLIISYHGYNGFGMLSPALPLSFGLLPPAYRQRPLKLLGDCE